MNLKKELAIFLLLIVLCVIGGTCGEGFFTPLNITHNLFQLGLLGIYSIGAGIVIITGGIDLSVGSVFALQAVLLGLAVNNWHWSTAAALGLTAGTLLALGLFHAISITFGKLQPFIVTLCGLLFYRGLARYLSGDNTVGFTSDRFTGVSNFFLHRWTIAHFDRVNQDLQLPMSFVLLVIIGLVMAAVLHGTVYGRYLFAVGRNENATRYSGINTRRVIGGAYVVGMVLAGVSGYLLAFESGSIAASGHGESYELFGIAAAVLGGCSLRGGEGSVLGIVLGAALIVVLRNLVPLLNFGSASEMAVMGAVIFVGVAVDELISRRRRRPRVATGAGGQTG